MTTIGTERLLLPLLTLADCVVLDQVRRRPTAWAVGYPTVEDVGLARRMLATGGENSDWGLRRILLRDGSVIGGIGVFGAPDLEGSITVGYGLAGSARGNGHATEALLGVTCWAAVNGARVARADTSASNVKSQRVLERAGFVTIGEHESEEGHALDYSKELTHRGCCAP